MSDAIDPLNGPHHIKFFDGPLEGSEQTLLGVAPFAQIQIDGDMADPLFHIYILDEGQEHQPGGPLGYKYMRTIKTREAIQFMFTPK